MTLDELNQLDSKDAHQKFEGCCASTYWVKGMSRARPFEDWAELLSTAAELEEEMTDEDWLEAFEGHPQIGDVSTLRAKYANTKTIAAGEQSGVDSADEATLQGLAAGNKTYVDKFGFIFIVCATGKSAAEMLGLLEQRLPNDRKTELRIAATEQAKITRIRLEKLRAA